DKKGNLYVVDSANNQVRLITPEGKVTTWAGSGVFGSSDGPAQTASFAQPGAATVDAAGNVFVSENGAIRKITPEGTVVTVARIPGLSPGDIAVDALGNLYIADFSALAIDKISADGT